MAAPVTISPYRVSTITVNGNVSAELVSSVVFAGLPILGPDEVGDGFLFAERMGEGGQLMTRGHNPRDRSRRRKAIAAAGGGGACRFMHQTTVVYRYGAQTPNIKIFDKGSLHLTGVKDVVAGERIVDRVIEALRAIPGATRFPDATMKNHNYKVRMINVDFQLNGWGISRDRLFDALDRNTHLKIVYEANTYQALKVHYYINESKLQQNGCCDCHADPTLKCPGKGEGKNLTDCKRVTLSIFGTGKMMIIGASAMAHVDHVYAFVKGMLPEHFAAVHVPLPKKSYSVV